MFRFAPIFLLFATPLLPAAELKPTSSEADLIALVGKLGGKAKLENELDTEARVSAEFEKANDAALIALSKHAALGSLDLRSTDKVTVKGFTALAEMPNLQRLYIGSGTLEPTEATAVGSIRTLNMLVLVGCKLTDAEIAKFAKLKNLKSLDLMETAATDKSVETILALAKLEVLNLSGTKVTDIGAKKLLALEALQLLQLNNTKVTDKTIAAMEEELMTSKRRLKISR